MQVAYQSAEYTGRDCPPVELREGGGQNGRAARGRAAAHAFDALAIDGEALTLPLRERKRRLMPSCRPLKACAVT